MNKKSYFFRWGLIFGLFSPMLFSEVVRIQPEFSTAGFFEVKSSPRRVLNFNPGWKFYKGEIKSASESNFDDSKWDTVHLPHGLEILEENASGGRNYQGPAWYRKNFTISAEDLKKKHALYFEGVMGKSTVWVNGRQVAQNFGGYLPFVVDATSSLKVGINTVAVLTDNSDDDTFPPGLAQGLLDFTYMGGIYRDVYLIETEKIYATFPELSSTPAGGGVFIGVTEAKSRSAKMEVKTEVANESGSKELITVKTILVDQAFKPITEQVSERMIEMGKSVEIVQQFAPNAVRLWTPNDPYLHFMETQILKGGKIVDHFRTRFGIRFFEMRGSEGFFVNGLPVGGKLMGVNRHQDYPYVGNALPKSGHWRDALLLREGGSTVVRTAHYPQPPAFLDACDQLGLLVSNANPGWHCYNSKNPLFAERMISDTRRMVRRDRNRPALLFYETALNETGGTPIEVLKKLHQQAHQEFPYPGMFTVTDPHHSVPAGFDMDFGDVIAGSKKNTFIREFGDSVDNFYNQNSLIRMPREVGESILLKNAQLRCGSLSNMYGRPAQCIGAALWAGIDCQRGYFPQPFYGGLLDLFRIPRYAYYIYKSQYDPDLKIPGIETGPMVYIAHELTIASEKDVIVYSNCEKVRLTWRGKSFGEESPDQTYKNLPHPPFNFKNVYSPKDIGQWSWKTRSLENGPAEMVAEGLIGGKVVCQQIKSYPMRLSKVVLKEEGLGVALRADGSDMIPLRASLADGQGNRMVLNSEYVRFSVEGPSEIIGGTFNFANPMKTQFGVATVLLKSTLLPGKITVRASVPGLESGEITIESTAPTQEMCYQPDRLTAKSEQTSPLRQKESLQKAISPGVMNIGREQQEQDETNIPK